MNEKLKPCPFCGGRPYVDRGQGDYVAIDCQECDASGAICDTEVEAISCWNHRACPKHRNYKAKRKPTSDCHRCHAIWEEAQRLK